MCGSLDNRLVDALDLLEEETGRMKGEASPYSWLFRFSVDNAASSVINLLSHQRSHQEIECLVELYDLLMSIRCQVRSDDSTVLQQAGAASNSGAAGFSLEPWDELDRIER